MIFTVQYTDVATLWVVPRAQWNKGQRATRDTLETIVDLLPFPCKGFHPDSGSEFINWHLKAWCDERGIQLTRSRPNHKNDNAYVEQKNGHVVRRFLGYTRLDCPDVLPVMNDYYAVLTTYVNHFLPSRKCIEKVRVGARYHRTYDAAQTPYARVLAHASVADDVKDRLRALHDTLNPLILKNEMEQLRKQLFQTQRDAGTHGVSGNDAR